MTEEQEWCLACGAAVGTRVVAAPGWRAPLIVAGVLAAVAAIAVILAIVQLADDTDQVAQEQPAATPTATPPPVTTPSPSPTATPPASTLTPEPTPDVTTTPEPTTTPDSGGSPAGGIGEWPAGEDGWTVVLASTTSESAARDRAEGFVADGIADVGVLNSSDFASLKPGFWVVYSGRYGSQSAASDALDGIDASDAYIRRIEPN